ncbi:MAG: DUF1653 domain-containing protein [Lentihominibacter sp.]|nr:DUF1653 domain-containing protein [Lentihominibacter sp.]
MNMNTARHSETLEEMVIYQDVNAPENSRSKAFAR